MIPTQVDPWLRDIMPSHTQSSRDRLASLSQADRQRLDQLLDLARDGVEAAVADLWSEFRIAWPQPSNVAEEVWP
jgi:hypothetical protein